MNGCHVPLAMGDTHYVPQWGTSCPCPCHITRWSSYPPCLCNCNRYTTNIVSIENKKMEERIKNLEESYQGLFSEVSFIMENLAHLRGKKPHKCPICDGDPNYIRQGTYKCHACEGKGIVWG